MHINFKYFIVSIGSIFLALGIGILIGSSIASNDTMQKQNAMIVSDIDNQFKQLKMKDDKLSSENENLKKSIVNIESYFSGNENALSGLKINSQKIGFISFESKDSLDKIANFATTHGGYMGFNIYINSDIGKAENMEKINKQFNQNFKNEDEIVNFIAEVLQNQDRNYLDALQKMGLVVVNSVSMKYDEVEDIVVYLDSTKKLGREKKSMEMSLLQMITNKKRVIAVQPSEIEKNTLSKLTEMKIPTINNIDSPVSMVSLVTLLNQSNLSGNYGEVSTGVQLIPKTN